MGIREYGRHRSVTQAAVTDWCNTGKIVKAIVMVKGNRKINWKKADKILNALDSKNDKGLKQLTGLANAKMAKETFSAKLAQLNYEQKSGKLCRVDEVERAAANAARITRDSLMSLPDKLSPILASETEIEDIRDLLEKEISQVLENLTRIDFNKES